MKSYIKTFDAYSFPDSLDPVANFMSSFIQKKFDEWLSRKNTANWKDSFTFYPEDFNYKPTDDFPLEKLHLSLSIKKVKDFNNVVGNSYLFKDKGENDPYWNTDISLSRIYRNKISTNTKIEIRVCQNSIEVEKIKESIDGIVRHEMLHSYQAFKIRRKNHPQDLDIPLSKSIAFMRNKYNLSYEFFILMICSYFVNTKSEFSAGMAELTSKKSPKDHPILRMSKEILSRKKEEYISSLKKDLMDWYPDIKFNQIPIEFITKYETMCHEMKISSSKQTRKIRNFSFEKFIGYLYDLIESKSKVINRKFGKILNA